VIPDIVTMAKSIGNGAPLAAVVTTPEIAATLAQRIHFNTFGGNPVSCAIGKAVLETIDREHLQASCLDLGNHLLAGMRKLMGKYPVIGDVRGTGLMVAMEIREGPRHQGAGQGGLRAILRAGQGPGRAGGQGRPERQHHPHHAADVHHQGGFGFPVGRVGRGVGMNCRRGLKLRPDAPARDQL
jgi:hypothetical protein